MLLGKELIRQPANQTPHRPARVPKGNLLLISFPERPSTAVHARKNGEADEQ